MCIVASRKSSTLSVELYLPMLVSAILVLIGPLVGPFRLYTILLKIQKNSVRLTIASHQCYVKLFAILLQFLCFQFLVTKAPQIGFGAAQTLEVPNGDGELPSVAAHVFRILKRLQQRANTRD